MRTARNTPNQKETHLTDSKRVTRRVYCENLFVRNLVGLVSTLGKKTIDLVTKKMDDKIRSFHDSFRNWLENIKQSRLKL